MKINLLFFGVLAELAAVDSTEIEFEGDLNALKSLVEESYPAFGKLSYQLSLNMDVVRENRKLSDGDTIAFMPPFAGG